MSIGALSRRSLLGAAGGGLLAACSGQGGGQLLRSADAHPEGYPTVEAVREMGRILTERTHGRLSIKIYSGGQMGDERDTLEVTLLGGIDLNRVSLAPMASIAPETRVPSLPFLFRSTAHMRAALDGPPGRRILGSLTHHGFTGLAFYDAGERSFYTKDREIRTPDDMRGLKIRVQNSELFVSLVSTLGANPTPMPYGEVYQGLLQGVVDGAENNWPSYESSRHFEAAPVYSETRHVMLPEVLLMSRRRWNQLSESDQDDVRAAAAASVPYMRRIWDQREQDARARVQETGVTVVSEVDLEAFRTRVKPVWDRFLDTPELRALAEEIASIGDAA